MHLLTIIASALVLLTILNKSQAVKNRGDDCHKGRRHLADCNVCKCRDGSLTECSRYRCAPEAGKSFYLTCVEREVYITPDCRVCQCYHENWVCGEYKFCVNPTEDPPAPKRSTREQPCLDGTVSTDACNDCVCVRGSWNCTKKTCVDQDLIDLFQDSLKDVSCAPQDRFTEDCSTCYCMPSGVGYHCIENLCDKGERGRSYYSRGKKNATTEAPHNNSGGDDVAS